MSYRRPFVPGVRQGFHNPSAALGELPEENLAERKMGDVIGPSIYRRGVGANGIEVQSPPDPFEYRGKIQSNYYKTIIYPVTAIAQNSGNTVADVNGKTNRAYLLIQNLGATNITIGFGFVAAAGSGITIFPNGNYELIGGSPSGAFVAPEDVYIRGFVGGEQCVVVEGLYINDENKGGEFLDENRAMRNRYGLNNPNVGRR